MLFLSCSCLLCRYLGCKVLFLLLDSFAYLVSYHFNYLHGLAELLGLFVHVLSNGKVSVLYELLVNQAYLFQDSLNLSRDNLVEELRLLSFVEKLLLCDFGLGSEPISVSEASQS